MPDKTFLEEKIRTGSVWRNQSFLVILVLPQTLITMGKSSHFIGAIKALILNYYLLTIHNIDTTLQILGICHLATCEVVDG